MFCMTCCFPEVGGRYFTFMHLYNTPYIIYICIIEFIKLLFNKHSLFEYLSLPCLLNKRNGSYQEAIINV